MLTAGPHSPTIGTGEYSTILYATDFSSGSHHALPYAVSLAQANHRISYCCIACRHLEMVPTGLDAVPVAFRFPRSSLTEALARARQQMERLIPPEIARS